MSLVGVAVSPAGVILANKWTPAALGSGLGAWWDPAKSVTLSGSDVTSWGDSASGGTADTLTGMGATKPQYVSSDGGFPAIEFNGSTAYFTAAGSSDLRSTAGWAISWWIKPTTGALAIPYSDDSVPQRAGFRIEAGGNLTLDTNGGPVSTCAATLTSGAWKHVAWVFDGSLADVSRGQFYYDGVAQTTVNTTMPTALNVPTGTPSIGVYLPGPYYYLNGRIGSIVIAKRALTSAEVVSLYNYQKRT